MKKSDKNRMSNIEFIVNWQSEEAVHNEHYFAQKVCFWRDFFPDDFYNELADRLKNKISCSPYILHQSQG